MCIRDSQKGVCLAQLKNYKEAVEAFKACYTKFPSAKNQLVKMALDVYKRQL